MRAEPKFAAIKRSITNDKPKGEKEKYTINVFNTKEEASVCLTNLYEWWDDNDLPDTETTILWDRSNVNWIELYNFFIGSTGEDAMFHWEWKRKGNFRSYRIIEIHTEKGIKFYSSVKKLYSFYNQKIIARKDIPDEN